MRFKTYTTLGLCFLLCGVTATVYSKNNVASPPLSCARASNIQKALHDYVNYLSSDALSGRLTGSIDEKHATQYIANVFQCLGFEPAGDNGTFFQEFEFAAGVSLGINNTLAITDVKGSKKNLLLDQEWRPLAFSDTLSFKSNNIVFAGYGMSVPALEALPAYDSYNHLNVKGKWVVVFRYTPEKISAERSRQMHPYSSLRYKVFTAKNHGAKGVIFVSGPNSKVKNELVPLSFDASLAGSGIVALSIQDKVIDTLLKECPQKFNSLQKLQDILDLGQQASFPLNNSPIIEGQIDIQHNKKHGRNVLAKLKINSTNTHLMVIGAHGDHLGLGEQNHSRARENEKGLIHHGADDNASGVATVLTAALQLHDIKTQGKLSGNKNILFAIWSGEELGLLGSAHFVKDFIKNNKSLRPLIDANINLDMVGRLRKSLILQGVGSSPNWITLINAASNKLPISVITQNDPYLPTDSTSFYLQNVPSLNFFTGSHDEYHTPRDTAGTLNYEGMSTISEFLVALVLRLEQETNPLNHHQVAKSGHQSGRGFRVYLGTIPDYASADIVGVTLSGVTKNSPAERAGVKANDVIVQLAGKQIHDIYDYTFALNTLHAGETVPLMVLRGNQKIQLHVVAQSRE